MLNPVVLPIGIFYEGDFKRNGLNIGATINLGVAEPIATDPSFLKNNSNETILWSFMNLALQLPQKMRGKWG